MPTLFELAFICFNLLSSEEGNTINYRKRVFGRGDCFSD